MVSLRGEWGIKMDVNIYMGCIRILLCVLSLVETNYEQWLIIKSQYSKDLKFAFSLFASGLEKLWINSDSRALNWIYWSNNVSFIHESYQQRNSNSLYTITIYRW